MAFLTVRVCCGLVVNSTGGQGNSAERGTAGGAAQLRIAPTTCRPVRGTLNGTSRDTNQNPAENTRAGDWLGCMEKKFVRYEASMPNGRGLHPGVFALANGLARDGRLSAVDWASWRSANDHYDAAYADPTTVDRSVYDRSINPSAQSWFKRTSTHLLTGVEFYTDLLHRYGVGWRVLYSNDPGRVLYEDDVQIVVAPH